MGWTRLPTAVSWIIRLRFLLKITWWPNSTGVSHFWFSLNADCGLSSEGDSDRRRFRSRIVGGGEISEGEIPWQVGWAVESRLDCQGGANFTPYLIFVVDNVHGENFSDVEKFHIERKTLKWDKSTYWFLKRIHFLEKLTHWYSNCTNISTELWIKTVILCATTKLLDVLSDQTENQKKKKNNLLIF